MIKYTGFFFCLICIFSCNNDTENLIADFEKQAASFEQKVAEGNIPDNAPALDKMSDKIGNMIIELSKKDLTQEQQTKVDEITLKFQITMITVEDKLHTAGNDNFGKKNHNADTIAQ